MKLKRISYLFCVICAILLTACTAKNAALTPQTVTQTMTLTTELTIAAEMPAVETVEQPIPAEVDILSIPLPEKLAAGRAEVSGMAWYGDKLVLLPQYPDRFTQDGFGSLFYIEKTDLLAYIENPNGMPVDVVQIPFNDSDISGQIPGFEGFESIVFYEDSFYITIESRSRSSMVGYVYYGLVEDDFSALVVDPDVFQVIQPQADFDNASEESILTFGDNIFTFYEDYGKGKNLSLIAHVFDLTLSDMTTMSMPNLEYRLTDVTQPDAQGYFWGINYFFPGDVHLIPDIDPIAEKYGEGETHNMYEPVERLVQFQITPSGIVLIDQEPIQFRLMEDDEARNWEGLVALDDVGFLIITDKFPATILGFCKNLR